MNKAVRTRRIRRAKRTRAKIHGTAARPRLAVSRSNRNLYLQLIDDDKGRIIVSAQDLKVSAGKKKTKTDKAKEVGKLIAQKAVEKKVEKVVFDRGGYKYHGRVKSLAEGAREGGLKF